MKRVFASEVLAEVGHLRNILEQQGIGCMIKNEQLSGALGDVPFLDCMPELWVLDDADESAARRLIADVAAPVEPGHPWICASCGESNESQYAACWRCGTGDDAG